MVFHEITKEAISKALSKTREIDMELVHAQETRRILDRLVGYTLSPLLWKKVSWGLSAGRVQSVAVRLLVLRERARRSFKSGSYWDLKAKLEKEGSEFEVKMISIGGQRIASGSDFDESTGLLKSGRNAKLLQEEESKELAKKLTTDIWKVINVDEKPSIRKPVPPFTTSTLQQEANRRLLSDLINIGQGVNRSSMAQMQSAAADASARKQAYEQAKSQHKQQTYSTVASLGTMAIMAMAI